MMHQGKTTRYENIVWILTTASEFSWGQRRENWIWSKAHQTFPKLCPWCQNSDVIFPNYVTGVGILMFFQNSDDVFVTCSFTLRAWSHLAEICSRFLVERGANFEILQTKIFISGSERCSMGPKNFSLEYFKVAACADQKYVPDFWLNEAPTLKYFNEKFWDPWNNFLIQK